MSRHSPILAWITGVRSAADGASSRTGAAGSPNVATAQEITGQATTNLMLCGIWQGSDQFAAKF
jgi:hypothetical protein